VDEEKGKERPWGFFRKGQVRHTVPFARNMALSHEEKTVGKVLEEEAGGLA